MIPLGPWAEAGLRPPGPFSNSRLADCGFGSFEDAAVIRSDGEKCRGLGSEAVVLGFHETMPALRVIFYDAVTRSSIVLCRLK